LADYYLFSTFFPSLPVLWKDGLTCFAAAP